MPATQRGQAYRLGPNRWGLRYYDAAGMRRRKSPFPSKSAALAHYRDVIEPQLRGDPVALPQLTLAEFIPLYVERHAASVRPRTIVTLRERLPHALRAFGSVPLRDLERMSGELASWQAKLPERSRYGIVQALRQALEAAVRWGYMTKNPAKLAGRNRQPAPRSVRAFTRAELDAISAELSAVYAPVPIFAAATGLRPEEWQALERRDLDRRAGVVNVLRTGSDGEVDDLAKTNVSRRQVPLTRRAIAALDALPARLDTPLIFPAPKGGLLNLDNFRRRQWAPAIEASGVRTPARIYDLRSTFASDALAASVSVFELARVMGTSVRMIERHYGALLDGATAGIASRLDAFDAGRDRAATDDAQDV
jgi:integrase